VDAASKNSSKASVPISSHWARTSAANSVLRGWRFGRLACSPVNTAAPSSNAPKTSDW
jgi:hypothetical protein